MLTTIGEILSKFDDSGIAYCHWKSNEFLGQALEGETDLDLLCERKDSSTVREILYKNGFVRLDDLALTGYPGIENYVGYDEETGRLIHVHLHFELTFGTPYLKEYVPPWASTVLEWRTRHPEYDVQVAHPSMELFLLVVRYAMKIRRHNVLNRRTYFEEFLEEYHWLADRADPDEVRTIASELLNPTVADQIADVTTTEPRIGTFLDIGAVVRSELQRYSTYTRLSVLPVAIARKGFRGLGKLNREVLNLPHPSRRRLPNRGIEVTLVGIDGSGKSTHLSSLEDWLSWKMDVHTIYFGSGEGRSSLLRYPLKKANQLRQRFKRVDTADPEGSGSGATGSNATDSEKSAVTDGSSELEGQTGRVGLAKAIWALLLTREKKKKRRRAMRARNRGMVVLMDRYPQNQFEGVNDGPLLGPWKNRESGLLAWIAEWESNVYAQLERTPPDLIVKLETDPELAKERKPETPRYELDQKATVIDALDYDGSRVVSVDTNAELETVLDEIKSEIWKET